MLEACEKACDYRIIKAQKMPGQPKDLDSPQRESFWLSDKDVKSLST